MAPRRRRLFSPKSFPRIIGSRGNVVEYRKEQIIFEQGNPADAVFYIQKGRVRITVVSRQGKEAIIASLGPGDFLGEGCLAGQPLRIATAAAAADCSVIRIGKPAMIRVLRKERRFAELFMAHLLWRNIHIEGELISRLFNPTERRLARVLLLLARVGREGQSEPVIPVVSQETLAKMIGATREQVNFFMNKFRKLGFIDYNGELKVHDSLLTVVVHD
jgi:CRP-like cAMP-binding protein